MKQVVIENPVINSPFTTPNRHFRFTDDGITNEVVAGRRKSIYFIPIAKPKKMQGKGNQVTFDTEWTADRIEENKDINDIRDRVAIWRKGGYPSITKTTKQLLEYWNRSDRDKKFFFCQIEALETAIYLTEAVKKYNDAWIENKLRRYNAEFNPRLFRMCFKMATGTGKTVVMAMMIAWQALNKLANPQDRRFSDAFLVVTPGITIRDRLRVLLPNDPGNYYRERDILPPGLLTELGKAKIVITNFHAFRLRETVKAGKLTKTILSHDNNGAFTESPDQMVRRVCRDLNRKKNIIVLNDEAHHCYHRKPDDSGEKLTGDERREAENREEDARIWISGLEAVKEKIGVKVVYDLSATPFFLRGSGYREAMLFPWVVSDFSLIDAIECGIVKVPRVPVADDTGDQSLPTYRNLWLRIRDHLPKKGRKTEKLGGEPNLPAELQGALHSLYSNYKKYYEQWEQNTEAQANGITPPVFIVVCNNTNVSRIVFEYIAGWEKKLPDGIKVIVPGELPIFNNEGNGRWRPRPNTILVDSEQLESGEALRPEFIKIAAPQIEEFKAEYQVRFPGRDTNKLTDEDLLREVLNTVGKAGKLGEHVKCVVSVSLLTEGWDANTVTHILGVRAFGTQLLCEQVVGRGLRRMSYAVNEQGMFDPEYAEVYGIPFSFIPCSGSSPEPKRGPEPIRVRALEDRIACEITFPRVVGYRYDLPTEKLKVRFTEDCHFALSSADIPTKTENAPIVGESSVHTLEDLREKREQEVVFRLAKTTMEKYFTDHDGYAKHWFFPQLLAITRRWLTECVTCKDNTFKQLLLLKEFAHDASDRIYQAIVAAESGEGVLKPILRPYDTVGSTRFVDFDTTRPVYRTHPDKCHISHVVADTESWEQKMASVLESMDEVVYYVKNHNLGFFIPYTINGEERNYIPDFIALCSAVNGMVNVIIEVSGQQRKDKAAKVATARNLWVPAINNHGGLGNWAFVEISDPWDCQETIRAVLREEDGKGVHRAKEA